MFLREALTLLMKKFIFNSKRTNFVPDKLMLFSVTVIQQNAEIHYVGKTQIFC
jgi:hypothetical protein